MNLQTTTCKLCGETFEGGVPIIGKPNARIEKLLLKLGSHLNIKHPDHAQGMGIDGAAFMGWLFLAKFKSTDEELNKHADRLRWQIHQQTLNARFSDESLREQSEQLAARLFDHVALSTSNDEAVAVVKRILLEVFTGLRNDLEEPNRYSEAKPEQLVS